MVIEKHMGDEGETSLLGKGRVSKDDARIEALGAIDEASSALGLARAAIQTSQIQAMVVQVQRDLYRVMGEVAATPENASKFRELVAERVEWLEAQISSLKTTVTMPDEFILPGDSLGSAALDLARTTIRKAERRLVTLYRHSELQNRDLLRYVNRLSTLVFYLELYEIQQASGSPPTLSKEGSGS